MCKCESPPDRRAKDALCRRSDGSVSQPVFFGGGKTSLGNEGARASRQRRLANAGMLWAGGGPSGGSGSIAGGSSPQAGTAAKTAQSSRSVPLRARKGRIKSATRGLPRSGSGG